MSLRDTGSCANRQQYPCKRGDCKSWYSCTPVFPFSQALPLNRPSVSSLTLSAARSLGCWQVARVHGQHRKLGLWTAYLNTGVLATLPRPTSFCCDQSLYVQRNTTFSWETIEGKGISSCKRNRSLLIRMGTLLDLVVQRESCPDPVTFKVFCRDKINTGRHQDSYEGGRESTIEGV